MSGADPYLVARLGEPLSAGGLEIRFDCPQPKCVARRAQKGSDKKLYVNFVKGVFNCLRCGWHGKIEDLYNSLGLKRGQTVRAPVDLREAIGFLDESIRLETEAESEKGVYLPSTTDNWMFSEAYDWLWDRLKTVPPDEVVALVEGGLIRRGAGRYWDRVFFCDVYRGKVRYWTARAFVKESKPKYLNPFNVPRRNVLFNQEQVESKRFDPVIVCEGTISAIVAGPDAVGTYGRCVTDVQINLLTSLPARRFILASESDHDAKQNTMVLADTLTRRSRYVSILDLPDGKDTADLGRSRVREMLRHAVPYTWELELKRRLLSCL